MKSGAWLNLIVGIWLLISPAALSLGSGLISNNVAFGVLAIVVAVWSLVARSEQHVPAWINFAFGVWLVISPWAFGVVTAAALWNNIICGVLLMVFALVRMATPRLRTV